MPLDTTPPRDAVLATGAVATVAALAVLFVPEAFPIAVAGAAMVVLGTARGSRTILGVGSAFQFVAALLAGIASLSAGFLLLALVAAVLAWDLGEQTINVTEQLGAEARLVRPIGVHAAASTLVGATTLGGVYATYLSVTGGQPLVALLLFLGGGALILRAMRL